MFKYSHTPAWRARKLAGERVALGVQWLDNYAPFGWQRHMFSVGMTSDGKLYAVKRFNSARSGEDVIALAFESVRRLAGSDGRVTTHTLSKHYGSNLDLVGLGFSGDATVSCELLDRVWLEALATYARPNWDTSPRMNWVDAA